jgi:hypothetical protein
MPFALAIVGGVLVLVAIRGTHADLGSQLKSDFTGQHNFWIWLLAIIAVGALGYAPALRTPSRMLLGLVILGMVISNQGVWAKLQSTLQTPPAAVQPTGSEADQPLTGSVPVTLSGAQTSGAGSGVAGQAAGAGATALQFLPFLGL